MPQKLRTIKEAKQVVYRLLKIRIRSEKEIREKLTQKEFDQPTVDQTLDFFRQTHFVDDRVFARKWIESRATPLWD